MIGAFGAFVAGGLIGMLATLLPWIYLIARSERFVVWVLETAARQLPGAVPESHPDPIGGYLKARAREGARRALEEQALEEQALEEQALEEQALEEQALEEQALEEQELEEQALESQELEGLEGLELEGLKEGEGGP